MEKKRRSPLVISAVLIIIAVALAVTIAVPTGILEGIPGLSVLPRVVRAGLPHVGIMVLGPTGSVILLVLLLVFWAVFILVARGTRHFWWMLPSSAVMYYTVYLFSQLRLGLKAPEVLLGRLLVNASMGQVLMILCFLLELTLFILFSYISADIHRRSKRRKLLSEAKARHVEATPRETEPSQAEPPAESRKAARQAEKAAAKATAKAARGELKRQKMEQKETDEEISVTIAVNKDYESSGGSDAPVSETPASTSTNSQAEVPLTFPPIRDLPRFKTFGKEPLDASYTHPVSVPVSDESRIAVPVMEPVVKDSTDDVYSHNRVFVGSVSVKNDEVLLTETPVGNSEDTAPIAPQEHGRPFNPMVNLRKRLAEDALAATMVVPETLPQRPHTVTIIPEKQPMRVEPPVQVVPDKPYAGPDGNLPPEEIVSDNMDDMEVLSGVGGLISSNEGKSALLTRNRINYHFPPDDLLVKYPDHSTDIDDDVRSAGDSLILTLKQFRVEATLVNIVKGPTVTMYEVLPAPGVRVSAIVSLADNIALQLAAQQIRIVAPIPGKQAVGIEVPNKVRSIIGFRDLIPTIDAKSYNIPMVLGRKITGEPVVIELTQTPHLLIAGATGSGKSVCVNSLISSILYRKSPKDVRLILVDPKIVELRIYNGIPHLLTPVITEPKKTIKALEFCLYEMSRRYNLLNSIAVRNITAYNKKIKEQKLAREKLPYIVVIIDEFADLMNTVGKELETLLARLAAMARAVGIHLVLATQRPSANVITGIIKSNLPTRIAFMVASQIDSRIIIDGSGAEKLLGKGDMLFAPGWDPSSVRLQGAFLSDEEVERVVEYAKSQGEPDYLDEAFFEDEDTATEENGDEESPYADNDDALMEKALKIVVERQSASASYLQRRLKIGYNRAARLVEQMEEDGYVGPARGSKPRELLRFPD